MVKNLENGTYYLLIGAGIGKVWKLESGTTVNGFVEPQGTAAHEGDFVPNYQTFVGLSPIFLGPRGIPAPAYDLFFRKKVPIRNTAKRLRKLLICLRIHKLTTTFDETTCPIS